MTSQTDNYPDLDKEMDISPNNDENLSIPEDNSSISETDFESETVDINEITETVVNSDDSSEEKSNSEPQETSAESLEEESPINETTKENIVALETEIASLKEQLSVQTEQTKSFQGQFMRLTADFDNFRRRTTKEKEDLEQIIKKKTIIELLPVVDNFERARSQIKPANDGEMAIHKSYQGVYKTFVDSLKKIGVSAMRPEGEIFDPNYHEAMLREPTKEYPEGIVMEQLVRGYMLNDFVLRHAMVKVAAPQEDDLTEETETSNSLSEDN